MKMIDDYEQYLLILRSFRVFTSLREFNEVVDMLDETEWMVEDYIESISVFDIGDGNWDFNYLYV